MGAEFGMLFCLPRLVPFYGRTGWERLAPVWIQQPAGTVRSPLEVMVKPLSGRPWPAAKCAQWATVVACVNGGHDGINRPAPQYC